MRATIAYVGLGKALHLFAGNSPVCGVQGGAATPFHGTTFRVTCKRCAKTLANMVELAHIQALSLHREFVASTWDPFGEDATESAAPTSRRQRRAARRAQARQLRATAAQARAVARAARVKRNGTPATARTLLVAAGLPDDIAKRYAGAFSKGVEAMLPKVSKRIPTGRRSKRVQVAVYTHAEFAARLATYRPKNAEHAALFALAG